MSGIGQGKTRAQNEREGIRGVIGQQPHSRSRGSGIEPTIAIVCIACGAKARCFHKKLEILDISLKHKGGHLFIYL